MSAAGSIDTAALLSSVNIVDVVGKHVHLKKKGVEHVGLCPFHDEKSPSFTVSESKQIYKCFGCGAGGDAIDFLTRLGSTFQEACAELSDGTTYIKSNRVKQDMQPAVKQWAQIKNPQTLFMEVLTPMVGDIYHYKHGKPSGVWIYRNEDGSVQGFVCRFDIMEDGKKKKEILPYVLATDGSRKEWRWQGFDEPRPLYDLHLIKKNPDKTVLVVEGEKTAEAGKRLLPHLIVTTWVGGANGINKTDFSPLNKRKVLLWPDNDFTHAYGPKHVFPGITKPLQEQPGNMVMISIAEKIDPKKLMYVVNPPEAPDGWDLADSDWNSEQAIEYARGHLSAAAPYSPPPESAPTAKAPPKPKPVPENPADSVDLFKFLGWQKVEGVQHFSFFANSSKAVFTLSVTGLTRIANLMQLAPLNWWERKFPTRTTGADTNAAAQWIISNSNKVGPYRGKYIRGRGAWVDAKRIVIHDGERLIVDGAPHALGEIDTKFIYETSEPLGFNTDATPLTTAEAFRIMDVLKWVNWERPVNSHLLAGWCVIAAFCGSLKWRPHIWLNGPAGSGKSWLFTHFVRVLLGDTCVAVQGETSEAGLRQTLGHDALPVVFDEAEGEDKRSQERMQTILGLMRSASAEDGGILVKGSAGGGASKSYRIRSCFAFASIGLQLAQQSDRTRVTILSIRGLRKEDPQRAERWESLQETYNEVITDDFVARLQARTIRLLPVIIENTLTFSNAAAAVLGEQRFGDQLGALLAGAYSLHSEGKITYEAAKKWVAEKDWSEERSLEGSRDETVLINYIIQNNVMTESEYNRYETSIGELVEIASGKKSDSRFIASVANDKLKRCGLSVDESYAYLRISNSHKYLSKTLLENTPWAKNHNKTLMRLEGAFESPCVRFGGGVVTRAVAIPIKLLLNPEEKA